MISAQSEISKKLEVERNLPYQGKTVGRQVGAEGELTAGCVADQESGEDERHGEEGYEGKMCEKNMKNKENMGENDRIRKRGDSQGLKIKADLQSQESEDLKRGINDSEERKISQHMIDQNENEQVTQDKNQHTNPEMEKKEIIEEEDEKKEMIDEHDDEEKEVAEEEEEEEENELFQEDEESNEEEEEEDQEEKEQDEDDDEEDSTQEKQNHLHGSNLTQSNNKKHMNSNKFPLRQSSKNALKLLKSQGKRTQSLKTKQLPPSTDSRNNLAPKRCHNQFCKSPFKGEMKRFKIKFTNEYIHLCQKCTERFKQKKYCLYCGQVYFDSNEVDGNLWIGCEECDLWLHQECEKKYGIKDIDTLAQDDKYKFYCLRCREKSKSQLSAAMNSAASSNDKLSINIIKAQQQIANCLNTSDFSTHTAGTATAASAASLASSAASTIKQTKKNKNITEKTKGKALIATIKQLKRQIFAPKPGSQPDEGSNHAVVTPFTTENNTQNPLEHKKSKKICTEIQKTPHTAHSASIKQSPHGRTDRAQHSEVYSFNLFLKAKRQIQALHSQSQNIQTQSAEEELLMMANNPNSLCDGEPNSSNASNQGISNYSHYHHHQRGRKEDPTNYIELPYKKQTVKETTSKKSAYHYTILQELLHPLSLSLCLGQEDINVDLQMYRSIALESRRIQRDEDQHSSQMHSQQAEDSFAAQGNLSSSSQPSESCRVNFSPSISKESSLLDAGKLKRKVDNEEYTKQQLNPVSPMLSQY